MLAQILLVAISLAASLVATVQTDPNYITNGDFKGGLTGWTATGAVQLEKGKVKLGEGKAMIAQRYKIAGLRIAGFGAKATFGSATTKAKVRARCYDAKNRLVMDQTQSFDPKKAATQKGDEAGLYFKTQAHTDYMIVSIEKEAGGSATVSAAWIHDYDKTRVEHAPECDLDAYMHPVWEDKTVVDESVLLLSTNGATPKAKLLFTPTKVIAVKDSTARTTYKDGIDYTVGGAEIVAKSGSSISTIKDADFPATAFPWLSVAGKHVLVTYEHSAPWTGPVPEYQGGNLPVVTQKLAHKQPVTIVALGDSITLGINVSGYRMEPPYMPTWPDLAAWKLRKNFNYDRITLYNAALGGMTSQWGRDNAKDAVASLNPDLVLIAFGMNDFWSLTPEEFRESIAATIKTVRKRTPKAEFILVSSIRFDPVYTTDPLYVGHMTGYQSELRKLTGGGVCDLDFTSLSEFLYKAKSAKDLLADPMHPDDFFARILAQFLVKTLTPPNPSKRVN